MPRSSSLSPDVDAPTEARRHLTTIAQSPRPAGGGAEEAARRYCAGVLRTHGFSVTAMPVAYSALPGRYATPLLGGLMAISIALAALLAGRGSGGAAMLILVVSLAAVAILGRWLARSGVLALPMLRERSENLIATRGAPRIWLVAHLDSKSQPVPIAVRAAALISLGALWIAAAVLALATIAGWGTAPFGAPLALAAGIAGIPVALSLVGARSAGARDNASGVATVLCTVGRVPSDLPFGIVLTTGEELGLAGARAWAAAGKPAPAAAINIDTIDDRGDISVMYTRRAPAGVVDALSEAGAQRRTKIVVRRLVPGILTDGVALADAGWPTVTVSKATMGTLSRVHTTSDTVEGMSAVGISETAALIADAMMRLHGREGN